MLAPCIENSAGSAEGWWRSTRWYHRRIPLAYLVNWLFSESDRTRAMDVRAAVPAILF
jgi:hypothetical protein